MATTRNPSTDGDQALVLLGIYLNDHLAGSTGGLELIRRIASAHRGSSAGATLDRMVVEFRDEREALMQMMAALGVPVRHYKVYGAWVFEKVGRFKLNGSLLHRSPLSDLVELEGMRLGVEGKAAGWRTLRTAASRYDVLDATRLDRLIAQARAQSDTLEELRIQAAERVTTGTSRD
ncbi:MAG: hypothetical protein WCB04_12580 [Mycobacteriales bacterium]